MNRSVRPILAVALLLMAPSLIWAQGAVGGADAAESYTPGSGSGGGYGMEFYPRNVLGLPDSAARSGIATIDPEQVLGLGLGGEIVLRFDRAPIVDGPGPDFTIFENAFNYSIGGRDRVYAEPGAVAVSRDGVHFMEFPFDSLTLDGCAGKTPTNGAADPTDPSVSGGDSFDLARLGIDSVRYVRVRDVTAIVKSNAKHPFWDMTLNGFDLDAIVAIDHAKVAPSTVSKAGNDAAFRAAVYPLPVRSSASIAITLGRGGMLRARLVDELGRQMQVVAEGRFDAGDHRFMLDAATLPAGVYFLAIDVDGRPSRALRIPIMQ